jgi:hypothetical protein
LSSISLLHLLRRGGDAVALPRFAHFLFHQDDAIGRRRPRRAAGQWILAIPASSGHAVAASRSPSALTSRFPEREETSRFLRDPSTLAIWSPDFFLEIAEKIETV